MRAPMPMMFQLFAVALVSSFPSSSYGESANVAAPVNITFLAAYRPNSNWARYRLFRENCGDFPGCGCFTGIKDRNESMKIEVNWSQNCHDCVLTPSEDCQINGTIKYEYKDGEGWRNIIDQTKPRFNVIMKKLEACKIYVDPGFYMLTSESTRTVTSMPGKCAMDISVDSSISTNEYIFISSYFEDGIFKCEYQALADEHRWWTEPNKGLKENNAEMIKMHLDIRPTEGLPNKSSNFTIYNHKQCQGNELQIVPSSEKNETVPSSPESREDKSDGNITTIVASATSAVVFIIVAVAAVMWWRKHMECTLCNGDTTTLEENELYGGYYQEQDTRLEDSNALYDDDGEYDYLS